MSLFLSKFQKILYYYIDKHTKIYNQNMECKIKSRPCKVPSGNDFKLYIRVEKPNYETGETIWEPFDLSVCKNITVQLLNEPRNIYIPLEWALDDEDTSKIIANVEGLSLTPGSSYGMQITGIDSDGNNFRWKARGREMFSAVDATNDANLNEDLMDYLDVKVRIGFEYASEIFATKEELNVVSGEVDDLTTEVGDLTTEVSGFQSAIETNTQNIEANTTAIAQNYATLTQSINAEAQTRSTNDQALQSAITTVDGKFELYYPKTDVYNKTEIDTKVTTINTSIGSEESSRIAADDNLQTQISTKANSADVYNKTSVDYLLGNKADTSTTYTKTEVDGLLDDKADSDDVYDKTEVYTKTEVDELIEEAGGTTYTDTILVGQNLITDDLLPTAKFGLINKEKSAVFSVGKGSVSNSYTDISALTPLNEKAHIFTQTISSNLETTWTNGDQMANFAFQGTVKGYDSSDTEFTIDKNYMTTYIEPIFKDHILTKTLKYREANNPDRNFDINITIVVDPDNNTTEVTMETTHDIKFTTSPAIFRGNTSRRDALRVMPDGKTYINATGSDNNSYICLQDKFSNIDTNINNINNTVSSLPTPEILSQTEYDNYLYHDPNKMYVTTEEDLTDYKNEYFTITPLGLNNTVVFGSFRLSINASNFSIEYSKDKITWTSYTSGSWYGFTDLEPVYLRGTGSAYSSHTKFGQFSFSSIQNVKISGNIMSLLYGDNFQNQTSLSEYNIDFSQLFLGLTAITDASKLILPATSLSNSAYSQMFMNCSNLIYGPKELPATTLTQYCYSGMFESCSKLAQPISLLPATNGVSNCYKGMYKNCISLTKSPSIRLTNGHSDFINLHLNDEMFYGCASLKYVEIMANHTLANQGLGSNFLYNVPNDLNSIFVMNGNSKFFTGIPNKWQIVKVTPPTNS